MNTTSFSFDISFADLYSIKGINKINDLFLDKLKKKNTALFDYLHEQQNNNFIFGENYANDNTHSIEISLILEEFIVELFNIEDNYKDLKTNLSQEAQLFLFRMLFVNKKVKSVNLEELEQFNFEDICLLTYNFINIKEYNETLILSTAMNWLSNPETYSKQLNTLKYFGAFIFFKSEINKLFPNQKLFFKAKKTDFNNLIPVEKYENTYTKAYHLPYIVRNDFSFFKDISNKDALHHSNYCVQCHKRGNDSCRIGLHRVDQDNEGKYQNNPLDIQLSGCPLGMHISQTHMLNSSFHIIAALTMITINNPLVAATGNSICVDCKSSCIFQKQEPVDTPLVETSVLQNVLNLPWGFEIYSLLTKWNPLRFYRPSPKQNTAKNILISGSGPSGFANAYALAMEGHNCIVIDMLKIESLHQELIQKPIYSTDEIFEPLETRINYGFGGVAQYGITSRWNKNYLQVIQLILARIENISIYGNVRLGSSISINEIVDMGFNHISMCHGAGKPNLINLDNSLCKGIKTASEFLMTLNSGAYKKNNPLNIQLRLPIVVLGAGLTAVDAATEALLLYKINIKNLIPNYINLNPEQKSEFNNRLNPEDKEILNEYIQHYELLKNATSAEHEIEILKSLGGCKIIYYKDLLKSNAYKLNHEELQCALQQGVDFVESMNLSKITVDKYNCLCELTFNKTSIAAKTLILALGTHPSNIILEEETDVFSSNNLIADISYTPDYAYKEQKFSVILKKIKDVHISFLGDMNQTFNGSVVKAIASSFYATSYINQLLEKNKQQADFENLKEIFKDISSTKITDVSPVGKNLFKVTIKNKQLSKKFQPGMILKIQNHENTDPQDKDNINIFTKPFFLTGIKANQKLGTLESLLSIKGEASEIFTKLTNQSISVLSPLGSASEIVSDKNILLIGESFTNNPLLSMLPHLYNNNNKITYLLNTKTDEIDFFQSFITQYTNNFIPVYEEFLQFIKSQVQDIIKSNQINYAIIGCMPNNMEVIQRIFLGIDIKIIAVATPHMLCSCKGICGACIMKKENTIIYGCSNQEHPLQTINWNLIVERLLQSSLVDKLTKL